MLIPVIRRFLHGGSNRPLDVIVGVTSLKAERVLARPPANRGIVHSVLLLVNVVRGSARFLPFSSRGSACGKKSKRCAIGLKAPLMDAKRLLGNQDLELIKLPQEVLLELTNEPGTSRAAEVEDGHDDDLIKIEARPALPDSTQGESSMVRGESPKAATRRRSTLSNTFEGNGRPALFVRGR
jgi:hypothetical protein